MRILLDAHVSGRVIGARLRAAGYDVVALDESPTMRTLDDPSVLELAATEERILVTFDVKDFPPLLRQWAEAGRSHAGCIVVHGLDHRDFGPLLRGLERLFTARPAHEAWVDVSLFLSASQTE